MTNRITVAAADVQVGDHVYNGPGASAHPTFAWETVTRINREDDLIVLITGSLEIPHGEFWFEPEEAVVVMRYPPAAPEPSVAATHHKHGHGH